MNKQPVSRNRKAPSKPLQVAPATPAKAVSKAPDPVRPGAHPVDADMRRSMIAQGAYFRAEQRGFGSGGELGDWLEAEREIAHMMDG